MDNKEFCRKAKQNAIDTLKSYFVEGNMGKVLSYFSKNCASWIGWGRFEIYPDYNEVFNTFTSRTDEILPEEMTDIESKILFAAEGVCVVLVTATISAKPQTGIFTEEFGRFTFTFNCENGEPKIVQLHSSVPWKNLQPDEIYPLAEGSKAFLRHQQQLTAQNLPAFTAAHTPNGLKCCLAEKNYPAVYLNDALCRLAGYANSAEMLAATCGEIKNMIYSADLPKVKKVMASHCSSEPYNVNYRLLRKDGTAVWVLERGQFVATDDDVDYFICSIAPLLPQDKNFNYGTLVDYEEIEHAQIPMDLYFKAALDIFEKNNKQTATEKVLKLCCSIAQISGAFVKDIRQRGEYMPVIAKYFNSENDFAKVLKCTPQDIARRFNSHGVNQCNDTDLLPKEYKDKLDALNVKAYLSKTIRQNQVLTFVSLGAAHSWTESEKDLITQTARLLALILPQ